jgi:hypothetical protein
MTTKTVEPIDLPAPVAAYFAADTTGAEAVAQCFTDGRGRHRRTTGVPGPYGDRAMEGRGVCEVPLHGRAARRPRLRDQTTVTGRVTGDFPGSPVDLQYRFTLEGDKIARLEIAP